MLLAKRTDEAMERGARGKLVGLAATGAQLCTPGERRAAGHAEGLACSVKTVTFPKLQHP